MTAPARFKKDDIKRAIAGATAAGMRIGRVEILPDGRIVLLTDSALPVRGTDNPWDSELAA